MARILVHIYILYDQGAMREHLIKCLETSEMKPFPVIRDRRTGAASNLKINVYCYCRCPDDGTQMVQKCAKIGFMFTVLIYQYKEGKNGTIRRQ